LSPRLIFLQKREQIKRSVVKACLIWALVEGMLSSKASIFERGEKGFGHVVGAGKTYTMVAAAMKMKRLGLKSVRN
jgi:hypothetical protein